MRNLCNGEKFGARAFGPKMSPKTIISEAEPYTSSTVDRHESRALTIDSREGMAVRIAFNGQALTFAAALPLRVARSQRQLPSARHRKHTPPLFVLRRSLAMSAAPAPAVDSAAAAAEPNAADAYAALCELLREASALRAADGVLGWDEQVMLPPGAADARGRQKAALAGVVHEKATAPALADAIADCERLAADASLEGGPFEAAVVRDARRDYTHAARVTKELSQKVAAAATAGVAAWTRAREASDWQAFAPYMKDGLRLAREYAAESRGPDVDPYSASIDMYERGMDAARLQVIFDEVVPPLKDLLHKVSAAQQKHAPPVHQALQGGEHWDVTLQAALCKKLSERLGFDFEHGRIDVSVHPFTGGAGPEDTRITTRYSTTTPFEGIMGTVHEVGHALYEQGRNAEHRDLPVSEPLSMGAHESQSLFWERMIAQSEPFWEAVLPLVHEMLPFTSSATAADFAYAVNVVNTKGLIRVDADELSYPFHIIMRFEIERGLFDGSINVDELPTVWAAKMKQYFDVEVPSDKLGCLQDVHWPSLSYGYFPSYTLGAMTAAQLFSYLDRKALPGMAERIRKGEFSEIKTWLNEHFHCKGSLYPSLDELLEAVTGEKLNPAYFIEYLRKKYGAIYSL
jgi:carboxypeptidase Taq